MPYALAFIILTASLGFTVISFANDKFEQRISATLHYYFHYYPKYKYRECLFAVKIDDHGQDADVMGAFGHYLLDHQPEAAAYSYVSSAGSGLRTYRIDFADRCDDGLQIIREGLQSIQKQIQFKFSDLRLFSETSKNFHVPATGWIDSPEYRAEYWKQRKAVYNSCDPDAWVNFARLHIDSNNEEELLLAYIYSSFAQKLAGGANVTGMFFNSMLDRVDTFNKDWAETLVDKAYSESKCRH